MSRFLSVVAVLSSILPVAALAAQETDEEWLENCRDSGGNWARARHCEIRESGLKPSSQPLTVDPGMNGGVNILGWDEDSISITARIRVHARTVEDADAIARDIKIETTGATVRASGPRPTGRDQGWSVCFVILVPHRTDLQLSTQNGPLSVEDVAGRMELSAENGPLSLSGVAGDVHARVENGPLNVRLLGARWEGTGLDAEATNGPAHLRIPENYNAKIEFGTVNGPMDVGFPMAVTLSGRIRDRISTTLGSGGPPIRVVTTNGPMTVRRQ